MSTYIEFQNEPTPSIPELSAFAKPVAKPIVIAMFIANNTIAWNIYCAIRLIRF